MILVKLEADQEEWKIPKHPRNRKKMIFVPGLCFML